MKTKTIFICKNCGEEFPNWQGRCPACKEWNSIEAKEIRKNAKRIDSKKNSSNPIILAEHPDLENPTIATGLPGLDDILGKGIVPGATMLLGGEPGIGKSTILLQLAGSLSSAKWPVLYLSGEESLTQLKARASRLGALNSNLLALSSTRLDDALNALASSRPPTLMIVDSIQTINSSAIEGVPGSVSQIKAASAELIEAARKSETALILVGHVTKDGQIAGPKLLEHMVDTVLYLEGERRRYYRILRVLKNRYGPSDEILILHMAETGLEAVPDPATFFLDEPGIGQPGSAIAISLEGSRPLAVEVQALAARTYLTIPRRTALGFDLSRLNLLLAVLEKHLGISLASFDIYAKTVGGLKITDPGLDLGIVMAVLSSFYDQPLPTGAAFWGELDLGGRVRPTSGGELREKQAKKLGYGPLFHAYAVAPKQKNKGLRVADIRNMLFGPGK